MKRLLFTAMLAMIIPAAAFAKGPTAAAITGPGIETITITGDAESGTVSTFGEIVRDAGFFPAVFRAVPNPMLRSQPKVELGPRYRIAWTVPMGSSDKVVLHQDAYPYAKPYAVTYMRPGQPIFGMTTNGGWFTQTAGLKQALVSVGFPAEKPSANDGGFWSSTPNLIGVIAGVAAAVLALAVLIRRSGRQRPQPA